MGWVIAPNNTRLDSYHSKLSTTEPDTNICRGRGKSIPARLCYFCTGKEQLKIRRTNGRMFVICEACDGARFGDGGAA